MAFDRAVDKQSKSNQSPRWQSSSTNQLTTRIFTALLINIHAKKKTREGAAGAARMGYLLSRLPHVTHEERDDKDNTQTDRQKATYLATSFELTHLDVILQGEPLQFLFRQT